MESRALEARPAAGIETRIAGRFRERDSSLIRAVVAESCADAFGRELRAVILIGSLAREEATIVPIEGGTELLGDAEFLLLFHDRFPLPPASRVAGLESAVRARLRGEGLRAEVELSPCDSRYLRSLGPHVFAYQMRAYAPSYRDRAQALRRLAGRGGPPVDCPLSLAAFASRVEACTRSKLDAMGGEELGSWTSWREAIEQARALWRWELARLTAAPEGASEQALWERWRRRQPARARLRGWLYGLR